MKHFVYLSILVIIAGAMIWGLVANYNHTKSIEGVIECQTYEGRLYLKADEYSQFKQYLANHPEVTMSKLEVISPPDALIDFEFKSPSTTIVPYGELTHTLYASDLYDTVFINWFIGISGGCLFITILVLHLWGCF